MPVHKGLDIDNDLFAHIDTALDRGRAHMRQEHDIGQLEQLGINGGFVFIDIEARACNLAARQHIGQTRLVNHLTARRIDQDRMRPKQLKPSSR